MGKHAIIEKTCKACNKQFMGPKSYGKFCSTECHFEHRRIHSPVTKVCPVCGCEFTTNYAMSLTRSTCSRACSSKFRVKERPRCIVCGDICHTGIKYCSRVCRNSDMAKSETSERKLCPQCGGEKSISAVVCGKCNINNKILDSHNKRKRICRHCGKEFIKKGNLNGHGGVFCNTECARVHVRKRYFITCKQCSKEFEVMASHKRRKFCSSECAWENNRRIGGKKSLKRKYRLALNPAKRFEILERDKFKCVFCGNGPPDVRLVVDHVYPMSKGGPNTDLNLCSSCEVCNSGKSDRKIECLPSIVRDRILEYLKSEGFKEGETVVQ